MKVRLINNNPLNKLHSLGLDKLEEDKLYTRDKTFRSPKTGKLYISLVEIPDAWGFFSNERFEPAGRRRTVDKV